MWRAIRDVQENRMLTFETMPAQLALRTATTVMEIIIEWILHHPNETQTFASRIQHLLEKCFCLKDSSTSKIRGAVWSKYNSMHTSRSYLALLYSAMEIYILVPSICCARSIDLRYPSIALREQ